MEPCCIESFVAWGISTHFAPAQPGDRHICLTCRQEFILQRTPAEDTPNAKAYTWQPVTH
jgi:hypothetical protein